VIAIMQPLTPIEQRRLLRTIAAWFKYPCDIPEPEVAPAATPTA